VATILDHLAVGTPALSDGWELFGGVLGGTWAYGGDSPGFWFGQLEFTAGPKIELLTPTGGPDAAFLERFLAARGAGPHHFNFLVSNFESALDRIQAFGIEPVGVNTANPSWKEAFLHPRTAHGIVIQIAQQAGSPTSAPPQELGAPGPPTRLDLIEHHVSDLDRAVRLFRDVLDGRLEAAGPESAELTWPGGKRIKLVREDGLPLGGALHHLRFARVTGAFGTQDRERADLLAKQLGLTVELALQNARPEGVPHPRHGRGQGVRDRALAGTNRQPGASK
jgi:methylmalonyl-CoA/ethylmalonyl-CoA epimerase